MKKIGSLVLALVMIWAVSISSMALTPKADDVVSVVASEEDLRFTEEELEKAAAAGQASLSKLVPQLNRSGNTTTVRLYLYWIATCNTTKVKYNSIKVTNTSALSPKTYKTFPAKTHTLTASPIQHVLIGTVTIPSDAASARVVISNVSVYFLPDGSAFWSTPKSKNILVEIK